MDSGTVSITLELELGADALAGRAIDPAGDVHPFSGWIGLVGVLDELIESQTPGAERTDAAG